MRYILLISALLICGLFFWNRGREAMPLHGDALGYYFYLPSLLIYQNLDNPERMPDGKNVPGFVQDYIQMRADSRTEKGIVSTQYTYGIALLEAPFFMVAHLTEQIRGGHAGGYTGTYLNWVRISNLFYLFMGLVFTRKLLRLYFDRDTTAWTLFLILLGTNLFWFGFHQAGMAHVPMFFLVALLMWLTVRLYTQIRWWHLPLMGLLCGIIVLIRPTNILILLVPVLYGVYGNPGSFREKLGLLSRHRYALLIASVCFLIPFVPQLHYWKLVSGHYIFDSYGAEQGFDFLRPALLKGIAGGDNGWLTYSPVMLLAVIGLFLPSSFRNFAAPVWVILPLYVWVIYSWYVPEYINGFGSRPMVDIYALLALPFAATVQRIRTLRIAWRMAAAAAGIFLVAVVVSFSYQQSKGLLFSEHSSHAYNMGILFKNRLDYEDLLRYDLREPLPDTAGLTPYGTIFCAAIPDSLKIPDGAGGYCYRTGTEEYPPLRIVMHYDAETMSRARFFRVSGNFSIREYPEHLYGQHMMVFDIVRGDRVLEWKGLRINNKTGPRAYPAPRIDTYHLNEWGEVELFIPVPEDIASGDEMKLYIRNGVGQDLWLRDLCLQMYR